MQWICWVTYMPCIYTIACLMALCFLKALDFIAYVHDTTLNSSMFLKMAKCCNYYYNK